MATILDTEQNLQSINFSEEIWKLLTTVHETPSGEKLMVSFILQQKCCFWDKYGISWQIQCAHENRTAIWYRMVVSKAEYLDSEP